MGADRQYRGRGNRPPAVHVDFDGNRAQRTTWLRDRQITGPGMAATREWAADGEGLYSQQTTRVSLTENGVVVNFTNYAGTGGPPSIPLHSRNTIDGLIRFLRTAQRHTENPDQKIHVPGLTVPSGDNHSRVSIVQHPSEDPNVFFAEVRTLPGEQQTVLPQARRSGLWYLPLSIIQGVTQDLQEIQEQWQGSKGTWKDMVYPTLVAQWRQQQSVLYRQQHVQSLHQHLLQPRTKS